MWPLEWRILFEMDGCDLERSLGSVCLNYKSVKSHLGGQILQAFSISRDLAGRRGLKISSELNLGFQFLGGKNSIKSGPTISNRVDGRHFKRKMVEEHFSRSLFHFFTLLELPVGLSSYTLSASDSASCLTENTSSPNRMSPSSLPLCTYLSVLITVNEGELLKLPVNKVVLLSWACSRWRPDPIPFYLLKDIASPFPPLLSAL